jgi:antitoxin component of MazEF toxin-antitoxin module
MTRKLTTVGNSKGILIPQAIMDLLGMTIDTEVEITTDGRVLLLVPLPHDSTGALRDMTKEVLARHKANVEEADEGAMEDSKGG